MRCIPNILQGAMVALVIVKISEVVPEGLASLIQKDIFAAIQFRKTRLLPHCGRMCHVRNCDD